MKTTNLTYIKELFESGEISISTGENDTYFLRVEKSYIKLNDNFFLLLQTIQRTEDLKEINGINDSQEFKSLCTLVRNKKTQNQSASYIYFKLKVIDKNLVGRIALLLSFLFSRPLFLTSFFIALFISVTFYVNHFQIRTSQLQIDDLILSYLILIIIMILHEMGHASACRYFGVKPSDIGFGFYIFFPVFFANVTNIWLLSKKKRIIVNIGGIYFQIVINAFLIGLNYYHNSDLLVKIISVNFFVACYSLLPFLRNDGYWLYSDLFDIPNLSQRSKFYALCVILNIFNTPKQSLNWPLFFYSIGNTIFLFFILHIYLGSLSSNIHSMMASSDVSNIVLRGAIMLFLSYFCIIFLKKNISATYKQITRYFYGNKI